MIKLISFFFLTLFLFQMPASATEDYEKVNVFVEFADRNHIHYFEEVTFRNKTIPITPEHKKHNFIHLLPCTSHFATNLVQEEGHPISLTYKPYGDMPPVQISCKIEPHPYSMDTYSFFKEDLHESKLCDTIILFITVSTRGTVPPYEISCFSKLQEAEVNYKGKVLSLEEQARSGLPKNWNISWNNS